MNEPIHCKILWEIKKIESGNDHSIEKDNKFWLFPLLESDLYGWNFETDAQVIQETQTIFGRIPKE